MDPISTEPRERVGETPLGGWIVAVPGGPWGERMLHRVAAGLDPSPVDGRRAVSVAGGAAAVSVKGDRDMLLLGHPGLLGSAPTLDLVRRGSTVVVQVGARTADDVLAGLRPEAARALLDRDLLLYLVPLQADNGVPASPEAAADVAARLLTARADTGAHAVPRGRLEARGAPPEVDFRPRSRRAELAAVPAEPDADWRRTVARFHHRQLGGPSELPLRTAAISALGVEGTEIPFALWRDASGAPRGASLRELLESRGAEIGLDRAVADNLDGLVEAVRGHLDDKDVGRALGLAAAELGDQRLPDGREAFVAGARALAAALPKGLTLLDLDEETPLTLYREVLKASLEPRRERLTQDLRKLAEALADRLRLDPGETASKPASVGTIAGLDLGRLAPMPSGTLPLGAVRRGRIEQALATIRGWLDDPTRRPPLLRVLDGPDAADVLRRVSEAFDAAALTVVTVLRAARIARLELADAYRQDLHDEALAGLDWEALSPDETELLPRVLAVLTSEQLAGPGLGALTQLLRSGRPVHVLVVSSVEADRALVDHHLDLAWLAMAHREATVLQSSLARPSGFVDGLRALVRAPRPGVVLARVPGREPHAPRAAAANALGWSRTWPELRYEPDRGASWAERFDLSGNPQPEKAWPTVRVPYQRGDEQGELEIAVTFADLVALEGEHLRHFLVVPPAGWSDEQVPLSEWVEAFDGSRGRGVPFVWVLDERNRLRRAVVTRELAVACRDRIRAWRVLQELAGHDNAFAKEAAAQARAAALAEAASDREALLARHAAEIERVRTETAKEALGRLAAALTGSGLTTLAPPQRAAPSAVAAPAEVAAAPQAVAPTPKVEEDEPPQADPWIESSLCTSCNDCIKVNGQLFVYNADKQVTIGDATAGTFDELVRAAQACPSKCIHVGKPRAGDATATPELVARAGAFA